MDVNAIVRNREEEPSAMGALSSETFGVAPVVRETVQERIYAELKTLLMQGRFQPGQALKIADLAAVFGTSHQPVREAIRQLVAERALEAAANRSARVPEWDRARLDDLRKARLAIEGLAAEMAAARATGADVARLARILDAEIAADDAARVEASVAQNREFHFTLYRLSGSAVLMPIIESLWLQFGPYIRRSAEFFDGREGRGAKHHTEALRALKRRDPALVRRAIERDIERVFEILSAIWKGGARA
jgi:DNA-binding GntR family transcriptional regulator